MAEHFTSAQNIAKKYLLRVSPDYNSYARSIGKIGAGRFPSAVLGVQ
jgi:hypothetical protein